MPKFRMMALALSLALPVGGLWMVNAQSKPEHQEPPAPQASASFQASASSGSPWGKGYFPNYPVTDQNGETYSFYDDLIKDKIVVTNFIFTSCTDMCGLSTARMGYVGDELGDRLGKDIFIYSISLTPEIDSPAKLKEFADAFEPRDGWLFLTGKPEHIDEIRYKLGERSRNLSEHRSDMAIGNGATNRWRRISLMGNLEVVTDQILRIDPDYQPAAQNLALGPQPGARMIAKVGSKESTYGLAGEGLFQKACSACHTIGGGKRIGPDLHGVTSRRKKDWLIRAMMEPDVMRQEKDPEMIALDALYPGVIMPDLDLSETDSKDVLSYIKIRTAQVNAKRREAADLAAGKSHVAVTPPAGGIPHGDHVH